MCVRVCGYDGIKFWKIYDPIRGSSRIATVTELIESNVALLLKLNYNGRYADEALPRLHS